MGAVSAVVFSEIGVVLQVSFCASKQVVLIQVVQTLSNKYSKCSG